MAYIRLKRSQDEEPLSGQDVLDMRQSIRDQNDQYRAAQQAVSDHYANGGTPYDLPDSTALNRLKTTIGGNVGQPKYVTDPMNPDNWERWSPQYKYLTGQSDYNPFDDQPQLTQSLEAATTTAPPTPPRRTDEQTVSGPVEKVQTGTRTGEAQEPKPSDSMYADSIARMTQPALGSEALGVPTDERGYPVTGGQYDLSQYSPEQIEQAKNTLIRAWNARNPVESYVIDMNKGSVWTNAQDPEAGWASALMGNYGDARQTGEGEYSFTPAPRASEAESAAWAAEFLRNGGVIGEYGNQTPFAGNGGTGTGTGGGGSSSSVTNNYYGNGGTSPYTQTGTGGVTPSGQSSVGSNPVTAWNGVGRPSFSYEINADPLYQMYREMYMKNGERAMNDTMARAAALTGGYGNSYAQAAGQGTYNQYMDQLNDVALKLYDAAYSRYRDDMGDYWKQYGYDYQRERDAINDARYEDELKYNRAWNENEREYTRGRQSVIDQRAANDYYLSQVDYDNTQKQAANNWAVNFASLFGSEEELLGALRNQYASTVDDAVLAQIARDAFNGTAKLQGEQETTNKQKAYGDALNTASSLAKSYYSEDQIAEKLTALYGSNLSNEQIRNIAADAVNAFSTQQSVAAASKQTTSGTKTNISGADLERMNNDLQSYIGDDEGLYNRVQFYVNRGWMSAEEGQQTYNSLRNRTSGNTTAVTNKNVTSDYNAAVKYVSSMVENNASYESVLNYLNNCISSGMGEREANDIFFKYFEPVYEQADASRINKVYQSFIYDPTAPISGSAEEDARNAIESALANGEINGQEADYLYNEYGLSYTPHDPQVIGYRPKASGGSYTQNQKTATMSMKDEQAVEAEITDMVESGVPADQIAAKLDYYLNLGLSERMYNYLMTFIVNGSSVEGSNAGNIINF